MSGIAGIVRLEGAPVETADLGRMIAAMPHRGPDGQDLWTCGRVGLAHCLLRTTEEAVDEAQPLSNEDRSVVLVFDGWLQNWQDLRAMLLARGASLRTRADSELILRAFEAWGHDCTRYFHGDFALAIWDGRRNECFCARDRVGMRPFHYSLIPKLGVAFASDPEALLALPGVERKIDEGRLADAIVGELEGFDQSSTFYAGISRLPPAHQMVVSERGLKISRYWQFEVPQLRRYGSDAECVEAFSEVFKQAVRCRMRGGQRTGAMLSGGLDSSSIVATARSILTADNAAPLRTFSAIGPDVRSCAETRAIQAVIASGGIEAHCVDFAAAGDLMHELADLSLSPPTPFDTHMTLVRAVYLSAHKAGVRAVLDGVGGDLVLSDGGLVPYLIRRGRWHEAVQEIRASRQFWQHDEVTAKRVLRSARAAATPDWARQLSRAMGLRHRRWQQFLDKSLINREFADRIGLLKRFESQAAFNDPGRYNPGSAAQRAANVFHAHNTAARERYEREASRLGIEPRDPFLDVRMIEFCVSLPVEQTVRKGWTKFVLRQAMQGQLPEEVRWRRGKTHLGWKFTRTVMDHVRDRLMLNGSEHLERLEPFMCRQRLAEDLRTYETGDFPEDTRAKHMTRALLISRWLQGQAGRS